MSLNIGNVLKAMDEGRWVKVPASSGVFGLKLKQLLPGEQYALNAKIAAIDKDEKVIDKDTAKDNLRMEIVKSKIIDWRDLIDHEKKEVPFTPELLKNEQFMEAFKGLTTVTGQYLTNWIVNKINKSDTFAEDDADFLANT